MAGILALAFAPAWAPSTFPDARAGSGSPHIDLVAEGPFPVPASPGRLISLNAIVSNTGSADASVGFFTSTTDVWSAQAPAAVHLDPGESKEVTVRVSVATPVTAFVRLVAQTSDGSERVSVLWSVDAHMLLSVHAAKPVFFPTENATGVVSASYPDGTVASGAAVHVTQTWTPLDSVASTTAGPTDERGIFAFSFGQLDVDSRLPGTHQLSALVTLTGATATGGYVVAVVALTSAPP